MSLATILRNKAIPIVLDSIIIVANIGSGAINAHNYFSEPSLENIEIITPQAEVIGNYSGNAPAKELDLLLDRIEIVKADNPAYASEIIALENTVNEAKAAIYEAADNSIYTIYSPIMADVEKSADDFVSNHNRSGWNLAASVLGFAVAGYYTDSLIKSVKKIRKERAEEARLEAQREKRRVAAIRKTRNTQAPLYDSDNDIWVNKDNDHDANQLRN